MKLLNLKVMVLILFSMSTCPIKASEPESSALTQVGKFLFNNRRSIIPLVALIYYKDNAGKDSVLKVCALILGNEFITSIFSSESSSSRNYGWQIDNEAEITRIPTLIQDKPDCGYHAIKNGKYVYQLLMGIINQQVCSEKLLSADSRDFPLEEWRRYILNKFRNNNGDGTNLGDDEIHDIIDNKAGFNNMNYIVVPDILDNKAIGVEENLTNIIRLLRQEPQRIQLFILGTMQHFEAKGSLRGSVGHWISIIVSKKGNKVNYYAMDSLSSGNAIAGLFKRLKHLIEDEDLRMLQLIPELEQKITVIMSNLTDAANKSGENRLANAMLQIQNIIDIFTRNDFVKNDKYVLQVRKVLTTMGDNLKDLSDEQKGWIEVELSLIDRLR
jgi:hypothetical protein